MKYLDFPQLAALSSSLYNETSESRTYARLEAYSCKPVAKERKLFRSLEEQHVVGMEEMDELAFSPEMREASFSSCFGRLDDKTSRKVHFLLISTLNVAFPDHDFSGLRADHFTREPSPAAVLATLGSSLLTAANGLSQSFDPAFLHSHSTSPNPSPISSLTNPALHHTLRGVIDLEDCEVYSYLPEPEYDPHNHTLEQDEELTDSDGEDFGGGDISMDDSLEPGWGTAGMEMDDVPAVNTSGGGAGAGAGAGLFHSSSPPDSAHASSGSSLSSGSATWQEDSDKQLGGLLWSANYFFFCKRQKRILFITCWSRKRSSGGFTDSRSPLQYASPLTRRESSAFPPPISSASFTSSSYSSAIPLPRPHHNRSNPRTTHKKHKLALAKLAAAGGPGGKSLLSKSAPVPTSPAVSVSRMTFKPRQTPARAAANAKETEETSRVRKDRSESSTPGPGWAFGASRTTPTPTSMASHGESPVKVAAGKRVKM